MTQLSSLICALHDVGFMEVGYAENDLGQDEFSVIRQNNKIVVVIESETPHYFIFNEKGEYMTHKGDLNGLE